MGGGALIIKLLGKSISYRILEQRMRDLWQLQYGHKLVDLVNNFYVVCFFSHNDYHVLEGVLWLWWGIT